MTSSDFLSTTESVLVTDEICAEVTAYLHSCLELFKDTISDSDRSFFLSRVMDTLPTRMSARVFVEHASVCAAEMVFTHPDFSYLSSRFLIDYLHREAPSTFMKATEMLYHNCDDFGNSKPMVTTSYYQKVVSMETLIEKLLCPERDYDYTVFGYKTLEHTYLLKVRGKVVETPQYLLMRVAVFLSTDTRSLAKIYDSLSQRYYIHASPTLFNAGTLNGQLASCFLLDMGDSIESIYATISRCAFISKGGGGIGFNCTSIRAKGSPIYGTNGVSNGLKPMLKVFDSTAAYVDQGGNKRNGAFAVYIEPWHADIMDFIKMKRPSSAEKDRAVHLFYALWIPDIFMRRVQQGGDWPLFSPEKVPGLADSWGELFEKLFLEYEADPKRVSRVIKAEKLWYEILETQRETSVPYLMFKDTCNRLSNQQNLGTIKCSNLCTEIIQYTSPDEVAVCNLASVNLSRMVENGSFNFYLLHQMVSEMVENLNRVIDLSTYPVPEAERSNKRHRPMGLGVQGLADVFMMLKMDFDSLEARALNYAIFERIYYAALETSCRLAKIEKPYDSYPGSPVSKGKLHFDHFGPMDQEVLALRNHLYPMIDWDVLRRDIKEHGVRNSLLVAPMPTASTSQILGNNECIEPYQDNIFHRKVLSGEYKVINQHLVRDLSRLGLWTPAVKKAILEASGSVKNIAEIPKEIKSRYRTAWELKMRSVIQLAADRNRFIDQSQSMNLFIPNPTNSVLQSMHFFAWKQGLKTGMYYLKQRPPLKPVPSTFDLKQEGGLQGLVGRMSSWDGARSSSTSPKPEEGEITCEGGACEFACGS